MPDNTERIIVVGAGNAALVAALEAHDRGADVIVLEAASREERGGNSRFAGATFRFVHAGLDSVEPLLSDSSKELVPISAIDEFTRDDYLRDLIDTSGGACPISSSSTSVR